MIKIPYINKLEREIYKDDLLSLTFLINNVGEDKIDGIVNYVLSTIVDRVYNNGRYYDFNRAIGVLESAKLELYRRKIAAYEDKKLEENGEVYTFDDETN